MRWYQRERYIEKDELSNERKREFKLLKRAPNSIKALWRAQKYGHSGIYIDPASAFYSFFFLIATTDKSAVIMSSVGNSLSSSSPSTPSDMAAVPAPLRSSQPMSLGQSLRSLSQQDTATATTTTADHMNDEDMSPQENDAAMQEYLNRVQASLLQALDVQIESMHSKLHDKHEQMKEVEHAKNEMATALTRTKLDIGRLNSIVHRVYVPDAMVSFADPVSSSLTP